MMNIVAIAFIFSSIAAASFFSSLPQSSSFAPISSVANDESLDAQTPKAKISSIFTDAKNKTIQFEESTADALKSVAERVAHKSAQIEESVSKIDEEIVESAGNIAGMAAAATREIRRNLIEILQRAWELGRDAAAFVSAGAAEAARSAAAIAHLLGFAAAYGTCMWVTFASNHVLASVLPRQQLGIVQSQIYPVYFWFLAVAIGVGLAGHILNGKERVQRYNLMAMLGIVLLNLIWVEPKATKAMFERMKLEKEEGRGRDVADVSIEPTNTPVDDALATRKELVKSQMFELRKRLKNLNNYSSFLNVLTLMGLSWHLVFLA